MTDIEALIADLEKGPSRELDTRIGMEVSPWPCEPFNPKGPPGRHGFFTVYPNFKVAITAPHYTSSLDAALTLCDGLDYVQVEWSRDTGFSDSTVMRGDGDDEIETASRLRNSGVDKLALALCIAALRARAAIALATKGE